MGGTIDANGFPDFNLDFDGRMIAAAGGQSGNLVLLNGQTLTMPYKAQQDIAGSEPSAVYTVEDRIDLGGGDLSHYQTARMIGSDLTGMDLSPFIDLRTTYPDDFQAVVGGRTGPSVFITSGALAGQEDASLSLHSGVGGGDSQIQIHSPILDTGGSMTLSGQVGTTFEMESVIDLRISTQSAGLDITIDAFANLVMQGGTVTITSDTGAVDINAASGQQMTLDTAGGASLFLTAAGAGADIVLDAVDTVFIDGGTDITLTAAGAAVSVASMVGARGSVAPTVTQSGNVTFAATPTSHHRVRKVGREVKASYLLSITGSGTANNPITVSLPYNIWGAAGQPIGKGYIYDASLNLRYPMTVVATTTSTVAFIEETAGTGLLMGQTGASFAAALANLDAITYWIEYEAAS